jgi:predicted heme/steroid binding protein/rubrerythrin
MYHSIPFITDNYFRAAQIPKTYKTLEQALALAKEAIQDEREDELFYDYLISVAPTEEEKDIIASIRDDERKHNKYFREIYAFFTGETVPAPTNINFERPESYIEGIRKAKFGELGAVERYRDIRAGIPNEYYRDMVFEILTDELKHAHKYDYILNLSLANRVPLNCNVQSGKVPDDNGGWRSSAPVPKASFTTEEAMKVARALNINFSKGGFDVEQFRMGLDVELEHGRSGPETNVTNDDPILTGKLALVHLKEFPDYYTRLAKFEEDAKAYWVSQRNSFRQTREFTLSELAEYDGALGKPAYVAVNGIVYDVSNDPRWGGASHFGLSAGNDLTAQFQSCHGTMDILGSLPKVGILKS